MDSRVLEFSCGSAGGDQEGQREIKKERDRDRGEREIGSNT